MVGSGRPNFHFVAPKGWLNDPCAPGYDEKTGLYHLFYQWNPKSHKWDDISWGHATSRDLISWEYSSQEPAFTPSESYDKLGIFTGCFYPTGPEGQDDQLSIFYTNVDYLPIKWDQPYKRGCEGLAMATSVDGGKTWTKYADNPLLSEEPSEIHVTGFRDPFLAPWPAMDKLRGSPGKLYGLISGGIHDLGPRTFLYEVDPKDLTKWTYLHPLTIDVPVGYLPSDKWAGDFGANWECTNFVSLRAHDGTQRELVFTGTEGGKHRPWRDEHYRKQSPEAPRRDPSYANWFIGNLAAAGATSEVRMDIGPTGMIDWGVFYASSSFPDPDGRTVVWGWMQEPDVSDGLLKERGWTGCMGIPREIYLQKISGVIGAFSSPLDTIASFGVEPQTGASSDAHTVYTLGIRPIIETDQLRKDIVYDQPAGPINSTVRCFKMLPAACEIRCTLEISKATKDVSFILRHNDDLSIQTSIVFDPHAETLQVIRELSTDRTDISTAPEIGSHTLLRLQSGDGTEEQFELLRLTIYLDHDVIELFANDRFALSTRVYTPPQHTGFSIASKGDVEVQDLKVWVMGSMGLVR